MNTIKNGIDPYPCPLSNKSTKKANDIPTKFLFNNIIIVGTKKNKDN